MHADDELTLEQARTRALAAIDERWPELSCRISETHAVKLGWLFVLEHRSVPPVRRGTDVRKLPSLVLVDRKTARVLATSRRYTAPRFARVLERLLDGSGWCLTMDAGLGYRRAPAAERARRAGIDDITPARAGGG